MNLVAELVRGMRVDDALMQMAVSTKRAAKVVAKVKSFSYVKFRDFEPLVDLVLVLIQCVKSQVITSARANAIHNFGMDKERLIVGKSSAAFSFQFAVV